MAELAKGVVVTANDLIIDGESFPWHIDSEVSIETDRDSLARVVVTILAENVRVAERFSEGV